MPFQSTHRFASAPIVAVTALLLVASFSHAQNVNPFANLHGSWTGGGAIVLSSGTKERIRCRASYTSADIMNIKALRLEIRCASDSYNFNLLGDIIYNGGAISGIWSEMTRGASGKITGTAAGDQIEAIAESPTFQAILELTTRGDRQSFRLQSPGSDVSEVLIALSRSSK